MEDGSPEIGEILPECRERSSASVRGRGASLTGDQTTFIGADKCGGGTLGGKLEAMHVVKRVVQNLRTSLALRLDARLAKGCIDKSNVDYRCCSLWCWGGFMWPRGSAERKVLRGVTVARACNWRDS